MSNFLRSSTIAVLLAATAAVPAQAVKFQFNNTGGAELGTKARTGFNIAAAYWSSVLTDNFTVKLDIGFKPLGTGILGSTGSTTGSLNVAHAYSALAADATSNLDAVAVTNLKPLTNSATYPSELALDAITSAYQDPANRTGIDTTHKINDNDGSANNIVLDANTANLKALGIKIDDDGNSTHVVADGSVTFSSNFNFDFNPTDGIAGNSYDFIGVAIHEIGHALGFVSGVDTYDFLGSPGSPPFGAPFSPSVTYADLFNAGLLGDPDIGDYRVFSPLDLFRYSAAGLDLSVGTASYFSIDGGSQLFGDSRLSTGEFNGDGSQASHWIDNVYATRTNPACSNVVTAPIGIMNPTMGNCEGAFVTGLDLAAFDAMGYNVSIDVLHNSNYHFSTAQAYLAFVPEPATWALMIGGFGMVGGALRRQRRSGFATA
jgi:hypothetical protein